MGRKQDIQHLDDGPFAYVEGTLCVDGLPLSKIAAEVGTPAYVYSAGTVSASYLRIAEAFAGALEGIARTTVHYAVKANGNLALLRLLAGLDAGFDVVSGGELTRVLRAGGDPARIVFAGVGKTQAELSLAIRHGVTVHVESLDELDALQAVSEYAAGKARISLRVNPDVRVDTHHHIQTGHDDAKFGVPVGLANELLARIAKGDYSGVEPVGVHVHVGSQLPDADGMVEAARTALGVLEAGREAGLPLTKVDVGGGLPLDYDGGAATGPEVFAEALVPVLKGKDVELQIEPGRAIVGRAGALVAQVLYRKHRTAGRMLVLDTGMHHLLRPALYEARHRVVPLERAEPAGEPTELVGPVCESTDVLGIADELPDLEPGDLVAILDAGAYGMTMASNYNAHPRPPEVVVEGGIARVTRRRETWEDQLAWEGNEGLGTVLPTRAIRQQMRVDDTAEFKAVDSTELDKLGMPKH